MTNVYRIGVSLAMSSNSSAVLGVMGRELLGIHSLVGKTQQGFSRLKMAVGGALGVSVGVGVLVGLGKLASAGKELADQQAKMYAAGLSNKEVAEATAKAWQMSGTIMGSRVHENLAAIAHLRAAIGDLNEAQRVAPAYMRNAVALGNITKGDGEGEAFKLAQAIHLSGSANDTVTKKLMATAFAEKMNLYTAMIAAGNGKLTASDLLQFQKQAGSYGGNLSDQGRINITGFIQAMGGSRAGTSLSTANRAMKDGILQKASLYALESVGMMDPKKVRKMPGGSGGGGSAPGGGIQLMPGALTNEKQFMADPMGWVWHTLVPQLKAHGITSTEDQINWVQHAKFTSNVTRLLAEGIRNQGVDQQEAANVTRASKADQYRAVMGKSFTANEKGLHDAWLDLLTALGTPLMKPAIAGMQAVTGAIKSVTAWANANPGKIVFMAEALVGLGVALVAVGAVALGAAAVGAVVASPLIAIGAALAGFAVLNWDGIKHAVSGMLEFFESIRKWVADHIAAFSQVGGGGAFAAYRNTGSAVPPPTAKPPIQVHTQVNMDGRAVARVVSTHQAKDASRASRQSAGHFDTSLSQAPPGAY